MRKLYLVLIFLSFFKICIFQTGSEGSGGGFQFSKKVIIENEFTDTYTEDVDVLITINSKLLIGEGKMNRFCLDVMFYDEQWDIGLEYYLEGGCNTTETNFWVRIPWGYAVAGQSYLIDIMYGAIGSGYQNNENYKPKTYSFEILHLSIGNRCPLGTTKLPTGIHLYGFDGDSLQHSGKVSGDYIGAFNHTHPFSTSVFQNPDKYLIDVFSAPGTGKSNHNHLHPTVASWTYPLDYDLSHMKALFCRGGSGIKHKRFLGRFLIYNSSKPIPPGWLSLSDSFNELYLQNDKFDHAAHIGSGQMVHKHMYHMLGIPHGSPYEESIMDSGSFDCISKLHVHSLNATSNDADMTPPYIDAKFIYSSKPNSTVHEGMIVPIFYENTNGDAIDIIGWDEYTTFNNKYVRYNNYDYGASGGVSEHNHGVTMTNTSRADFIFTMARQCDTSGNSVDMSHRDHVHKVLFTPLSVKNEPYGVLSRFIRRKYSFPSMINHTVLKNTWSCFSKDWKDEDVCSGSGYCYSPDECTCFYDEHYYGLKCNEEIVNGVYVDQYEIHVTYNVPISVISLFGDGMDDNFNCNQMIVDAPNVLGEEAKCSWIAINLLNAGYLRIQDVKDKKVELLTINPLSSNDINVTITIAKFVKNNDEIILYILIGAGIVAGILAVLLVVVGFVVVIIVPILFCQQKRLQKFKKVKDIDLIIKEHEADKDQSIAKLNINKKLFEIRYNDIKIIKKIGEGGSNSVVFKGEWLKKMIAFKCFRTQDICSSQDKFDEFSKEVNILAGLNHPNILQFFGATLRPPRVGIVMEYCEFGDLKLFLTNYRQNNSKSFDYEEKIRMLMEISSACAHLHKLKIIHRDLKCENVLVTKNYDPKLMDFGLSKVVDRMSQAKTKRVGTSVYMAPEVSKGGEYTEKCDTFSYAIMIYEIITDNFTPYGKSQAYNLEFKVANDPSFRPKVIGDMFRDKWLQNLMKQCWNHNPDKRPTFEEILEIVKTKGNVKLERKYIVRQSMEFPEGMKFSETEQMEELKRQIYEIKRKNELFQKMINDKELEIKNLQNK